MRISVEGDAASASPGKRRVRTLSRAPAAEKPLIVVPVRDRVKAGCATFRADSFGNPPLASHLPAFRIEGKKNPDTRPGLNPPKEEEVEETGATIAKFMVQCKSRTATSWEIEVKEIRFRASI